VASATTSLHSTAPVPTPAALTPAVTVAPPIGGTTVPVPPTLAPAAVPTLRILAPKPGDVIAAPWAIQYAVSDFAAGPSQGSIRLTLGDGGAFALNLSLSGPSGVVYLSDLRVSGLRTLVFTLMNASQQPLGNPEATVTVPNVTLTGLR
jgi:hypothetical protein